MHDKWLIVANRASARLIEVRDRGKTLSQLEIIDNPQGKLHDRDIDADRPGRAFDSRGEGRHAMGREESASEHVAEEFARRLASRLATARAENAFDELVLVAEPRFLGRLRAALDSATAATVVASLDKDLAQLDLRELPSHLGELLRPVHPR